MLNLKDAPKVTKFNSLVKEGSYYKITYIDTDHYDMELHDGIHLVVDYEGITEKELLRNIKEHESIWFKHVVRQAETNK
ncbi:hypothetical protein ACI2JA_03915 [Alkalihalobacillus sp. NPDC078783]